jgi:hypothetical protein
MGWFKDAVSGVGSFVGGAIGGDVGDAITDATDFSSFEDGKNPWDEMTPWDTQNEKAIAAKKLEDELAKKAKTLGQQQAEVRKVKEQQLKEMVEARQAIINPNDQLENQFAGMTNQYANMTDKFAGMTNQYDGMTNQFAGMSNEMANLGVATQASEFQAEEADIALANTLDTMRASGAGAGGATALAQAALQSKRGISADLQKQEAANQKAAAQGAQQIQTQIAQGATNIQTQQARGAAELQAQQAQGANDLQMNIARGAADVDRLSRQGATDVQNQFAAGRQFAFSVGEQRQNQDIDRAAQQLDNYNKRVADAAAQLLAAQTS